MESDPQAAGWMPLRLVAVAPLAGHNPERPPGLLRVVKGALDESMSAVSPSLMLHVKHPATGTSVEVQLRFASFGDFGPLKLVGQIPEAARLLGERGRSDDRSAEIDALLSRWLDQVIHHPAFLELEAAWLGLKYLAHRGEAGAGALTPLALEVLVTGAGEDYLDRFRKQVFDPDYEDRVEVPMAATLVDGFFDHQPASLSRIETLAGLANALQAPVIGGAGPSFFGLKNLAHLPALPDLVTRTAGGPYAGWNAFQRDTISRWVCLTVNRFLLRAPHDAGGDGAGDFCYRETADPAHPEWLCWGNAIWAAGAGLAHSYAQHGHCAAADGLSESGGHHGLPTIEVAKGANKTIRVASEIILPDEKAWDLCRAGFTPILGMADGDVAYFPFLGNVYRPRVGSITIDQALVYQLYAGQLSHVVLKLSSGLPAGSPEEGCRWLEREIFAFLSPWVGDTPGQNVKVTAASLPDGRPAASIHVTPTFKIQNKPVDLELRLPLR
jgi:type VI secretion system protein ImpC